VDAPEETGSGGGTEGAAAGEGGVAWVIGSPGEVDPLVNRSGWRGLAQYGPCTLAHDTDPAAVDPVADQRRASDDLLAALRASDAGQGATAVTEVVLPQAVEPGTGVSGINALVQDWTTSTPHGDAAVRAAVRVVSTTNFDGTVQSHAVQLAFECPRALDEDAWATALEGLRVTVPAPAERAGEWPTA
jgi:hypothetical protein